ncbi:MAG: pseudouridine synthase [Cetobacterium sp.]|uniref:pseudouridine synthase n=1 Tax=unclassified Cetobacterium TaxID=2630983 RepID=UPI00163D15D3|nr:rRNA pseudouridine synthase [Cetobacterium sp. 2A]
MRINKYLSSVGIASRREIDRLIEIKAIKVNGVLATAGLKVTGEEVITINGKPLEKNKVERKVYYMLNKPKGVLSTAKDDRGRKTVIDLIDCPERIFPIGRLDSETEGLILLTNDGELFNRVIHPKAEVYKEYFAIIAGEVKDKELSRLAKGVILEDGATLPAKVKIIRREKGKSEVSIAIREGRNRQVRRMFDAIKHPVKFLRRDSIGKITLRGLEVGSYRKLTREEVLYLQSM